MKTAINDAVFYLVGVAFGIFIGHSITPAPPAPQPVQITIPDQQQFQQLLNAVQERNQIEADGVCGKQTRQKWDSVICDLHAARWFEGGAK